MSATEIQFRTSTLGGFNKQDVLSYLELSSRTHTDKVGQLSAQIEEAVRAKSEAEQASKVTEDKLDEITEENAHLNQDLKVCEDELTEAKRALAAKDEEVRKLIEEKQALRARLEKIEPEAVLYERIKDRTAGVELEALRRAQEIEDEATARAKQTKEELDQWVHRVQHNYKALQEEMNQSVAAVSAELQTVTVCLEKISVGFTSGDAGLEELLHSCAPVVQMPMPLEE